jgi:mannose-1-phosphate guanylyltransferase
MLHPVILAGGSGTRLWPLSREAYPKQFINLIDSDFTMLQATINRLSNIQVAAPFLMCNEDHRFLAAEQLRQNGHKGWKIMLESAPKNTAPAIALAALELSESGDDPVMLVLPADHVIDGNDEFNQKINLAHELAKNGKIVTFGVKPNRPETGYGYICAGKLLSPSCYEIASFKEKPDNTTAQAYVDSGSYYWNSGMYVVKASTLIHELGSHRPDILEACRASMKKRTKDVDFIRIDPESFAQCPSESIDFAIMERTKSAVVVELNTLWSDVGSWSSLWEMRARDCNGNCLMGDVVSRQTTNSLIQAEERLVVALGVKDLVIVETKDVVLVSTKEQAEDIKNIVTDLKFLGRAECSNHVKVYRPWGVFDSIDKGDRYQVKRITVKPGAKLSVQMHHHRAEHWVVVSGTAKVTNGDKTYLVTENQSTYIPIGQMHSLENPGVIDLELIEVQSGAYLGEDDIVRTCDMYGRV